MLTKIAINSRSTGKFRTEVINNRPHLVTEMVSIVGDSVMNRLFYPLADVANSFDQLDQLPAPADHPVVNGVNVSAFHPLAINAFHVGGMVRKPRMVGNQVINELVFDIEVANKDDRGKAIIERIEKGEAIGVSTGLNADVTNSSGKHGDEDFDGVISNIQFDHVAVLLNDKPAGDATFTINKDVMICNLAESVNELERKVQEAAQARFGATDRHIWVQDILFTPDRAIIDLNDKLMMVPFGYNDAGDVVFTDDGVEVERKVIFETVGNSASKNLEGSDMDKLALVLAIIGNSSNRYTSADKDKLMAMSETDLVGGFTNSINPVAPTIDQAQEVIEAAGMTINAASFDKGAYEKFVANADEFTEFMANKDKVRGELVDKLVENSKMSKEDVEAMSDTAMESLANSLMPGQNYSVQGQPINNNDRQEVEAKVDYS